MEKKASTHEHLTGTGERMVQASISPSGLQSITDR